MMRKHGRINITGSVLGGKTKKAIKIKITAELALGLELNQQYKTQRKTLGFKRFFICFRLFRKVCCFLKFVVCFQISDKITKTIIIGVELK